MGSIIHDSALASYIDRVRAVPRLSREEEHEIALRVREGDRAAADALIAANLRFVVAVALQYRRYGIPLSELIAEGSLGLMLAVTKFSPERGTRFVTYAGYWIRAYVLELIVRSASMVGAGSGALRSKVFFRLRREAARLSNTEPDRHRRLEILAERFDVDVPRIQSMLRQIESRDLSLDARIGEDSSLSLVDTLVDQTPDQEHEFIGDEHLNRLRQELRGALATLDRRERYIVEHRILGDDDVSLAELGRRLGVSRERARQLESRAKRKLRQRLEAFERDAA